MSFTHSFHFKIPDKFQMFPNFHGPGFSTLFSVNTLENVTLLNIILANSLIPISSAPFRYSEFYPIVAVLHRNRNMLHGHLCPCRKIHFESDLLVSELFA